MSRHVLFTAVKNEAPFLLEWIAYHKAIGFDTVIVFSNPSDDGTDELLAALAVAGEITHVPHEPPVGVSAQGNAARLANEMGLIVDGDWVMWLDADEFLNVHAGEGKLADLIGRIGDAAGMLIPWRIFGDGGNSHFPGRFISDDFVTATAKHFPPTREIKTLFQASPKTAGFAMSGINRPIVAPSATPPLFLSAAGTAISNSDVNLQWLAGQDVAATNRAKPADFSWRLAQINHYMLRTPEFFRLKRLRGRGWATGQAGASNSRHTDAFYAKMNRNDRQDRSILRHRAATDIQVKRILSLEGVAEAAAFAERATAMALMRAACRREAEANVQPEDFKLTLPAPEAALLRETYAGAEVVLEYGSGGSTFVAARSAGQVTAVENDPDWALRMATALGNGGLGGVARVHFEDVGSVGEWARPTSSAGFRLYHRYASAVWEKPWFVHPDVVLIDGRFRTSCLINAIMRAEKPMTVLFDDYAERPNYFWVEQIVKPRQIVGRMAVFEIVPGMAIPAAVMARALGSFTDVE
ncbi:glycosyltransferase family 2 protein [Neogemmobacter tilapiae]|uniref:Glycosyltransferase family 2 protein n=1 Tax=Neogemmobacter tilapiae TaxID=875041 RepID=A0A918TET7_9RHOB|nr:glycosyltransferase family 2 protein [Gemmobacter tilapiae]GHC43627.1 hypothetical protein GCM10007315_00840 [Gemmobacter tilapiae]